MAKPDKATQTGQTVPESPSTLSNVTALARFEFEEGKSNDGTKILMVEWQDEAAGRSDGSWQVTWSGKTIVLKAENKTESTKRLFFLLPPLVTVPPQVTLSWTSSTNTEELSMTIPTLPAIFTPQLGASSKSSGKKGVLHTIWAKSRLQVLEQEIKAEEKFPEGIALEMATSERDWILQTFGITPKVPALDLSSMAKSLPNGQLSPSLQSPRTPGGRRLSEKLKGLSIGTSEKDLARGANTPTREFHPLSPEASDVAYSSFNSFRGNGPISAKVKSGGKSMVPQRPPEHIVRQQQQSSSIPLGYVPKPEKEDDSLFAIALSPRTPDIAKSPFSFSSEEVAPYAKIKGERLS